MKKISYTVTDRRTKNAEIHKINKLYEVRLFNFNQYEESFNCLI